MVKTAADFIYQIEHINAKYTKQSAAISGVRALLNLVRELVAYAYLTYLVLKTVFPFQTSFSALALLRVFLTG